MRAPRWMSWLLIAAAVYNLVWGALVIVAPKLMLDAIGFHDGNYPGIEPAQPLLMTLWQCVGMIVGVYGIGYAAAALDPLRHWPIVLVGFLGKVFGPIGFVMGYLQGQLPGVMFWTNVTNDLIWLPGFAAILWLSAKAAQAPPAAEGDGPDEAGSLSDRLQLAHTQAGDDLLTLSQRSPLLLVFLRHQGCTFCREALQDVAEQRQAIEASGARIVLVHMGDNEQTGEFYRRYGLDDVARVSDPSCTLYRGCGLERGKFSQLFGLGVWWRGFETAILRRHGLGPLVGDGFQMPGVFLVENGQVIRSFCHRIAADRPDYAELACPAPAESSITSAQVAQ